MSNASFRQVKPFLSVGFLISSTGVAVARGFCKTLEPLALVPREFALLRAVATDEGRSQQAIGDGLQIPPSRMVSFIDALEGRGLVQRRQSPDDRRVHALHLTSAGEELLEAAFALASEYERELCGELSDPEREQLLDLLRRVARRLGIPDGTHAAHQLDGEGALADAHPACEP